MKLSDASKIYAGSSEASKIYLGAEEVWSGEAEEIAANSVALFPSITASHTLVNGAYGFDIEESDYAVVQTDSECWIQIDFGCTSLIKSIRLRGGPDNENNQAMALKTSIDGVNWETIASWFGQTYYGILSAWFDPVEQNIRYIRVTKAAANFFRLHYMGVKAEAADDLDFLVDGTATASSTESGSSPANAVDNYIDIRWNNNNLLPAWWKYDLGEGITKKARRLRLWKIGYDHIKNFTLSGSNNDSDWTELTSGLVPQGLGVWNTYDFENATSYRYYKLDFPDSWSDNWMSIGEVEMMEALE